MNKRVFSLATLQLSTRIAMRRQGVAVWLGGGMLLVAAILALTGSRWLAFRTESLNQETRAFFKSNRKPEPTDALPTPVLLEQRRLALEEALGDSQDSEEDLAALFRIAEKRQLIINEADYRSSRELSSGIVAYRITLPLKGNFGAIQQFCEESLLTMPYMSLDQIAFSRESAATPVTDAKLQITFYLRDTGQQNHAGPGAPSSLPLTGEP